MTTQTLYTEETWERFSKKLGESLKDFKLKTYIHLDPIFNFFQKKEQIHVLVKDLTLQSVAKYPFTPFVKILTKTPRYRYDENVGDCNLETKIRPISFASHFDTYIYAFYAFALTEKYQDYIRNKGFSDCVLAYRTDLDGNCNIQFAKEAFDKIKEKINNNKVCTAIALDISGYFDNIEHNKLKEKWCKIINTNELPIDQYKIYKSLTKYNYVNKNSVLNHFRVDLNEKKKKNEKWSTLLDLIPNNLNGKSFNDKMNLLRKENLIVTNLPKKDKDGKISFRGIPQGSSLSALLSNVYLVDFDEWLYGLSVTQDFIYRRYCDDLLIICNPESADNLTNLVIEKIKEYELKIQEKKTELIEFSNTSQGKIRGFNKKRLNANNQVLNKDNEQKYFKNLQYLGFEFNGENIYIRPGSLSRYFRKMKARIGKTIMMAYSSKSKTDKILKKQIFERYSHLGNRNFISYAIKASKEYYSNSKKVKKEGMNSKNIRKQLASHFSILEREILNTSVQRYKQIESKRENRKNLGKRPKSKKEIKY